MTLVDRKQAYHVNESHNGLGGQLFGRSLFLNLMGQGCSRHFGSRFATGYLLGRDLGCTNCG